MDSHDGWLYFSQAVRRLGLARPRHQRRRRRRRGRVRLPAELASPAAAGIRSRASSSPKDRIFVTSSDPHEHDPRARLADRKKIYVVDLDGQEPSARLRHRRAQQREAPLPPGHDRDLGLRPRLGQLRQDVRREDQARTSRSPTSIRRRNSTSTSRAASTATRSSPATRVPRPEFADRKDIVELAGKTIVARVADAAHTGRSSASRSSRRITSAPTTRATSSSPPTGAGIRSSRSARCVEPLLFDDVTGKPYGSMTIVDCQGRTAATRGRSIAPKRPTARSSSPATSRRRCTGFRSRPARRPRPLDPRRPRRRRPTPRHPRRPRD